MVIALPIILHIPFSFPKIPILAPMLAPSFNIILIYNSKIVLAKVQKIEDADTEQYQVSLPDGFTNIFFFNTSTNYWEEQDLGITRLSDAVGKQMHKILANPDNNQYPFELEIDGQAFIAEPKIEDGNTIFVIYTKGMLYCILRHAGIRYWEAESLTREDIPDELVNQIGYAIEDLQS